MCSVNADCTTDPGGQVSWTYTDTGGPSPPDDIIQASFTNGTGVLRLITANKEWVAGDTTPPRCEVIGVIGGDLHVEVEDSGAGLKEINVLVDDNANVNIPAFAAGTNAIITVVATKFPDPNAPARVVIEAFDNSPAMNRSECDPVLVSLTSDPGSGVARKTVTGVPDADRYLTLYNNDPSAAAFILVTVNGKWFTVLTGAETIDVGPAMVEGSDNTVALWGWGAEGTVMLSDVVPSQDSGSVGWTLPLWAVPLWHGYNSSLPW